MRDPRRPPAGDVERHVHDAGLVARCLEGDEAAWSELLQRHRPLILAVARRSGLRGDVAEDLYQATCITLLQRLEILRDHRSLAAWVATTAARKAWRLKRSLASAKAPPDAASMRTSAPRPDQEFAWAEERTAVREALEEMPEPCRTLLTRLFVEDAAYDRVAQELGIALGSVGVYRRRCLDRLRRRLEGEGRVSLGEDADE